MGDEPQLSKPASSGLSRRRFLSRVMKIGAAGAFAAGTWGFGCEPKLIDQTFVDVPIAGLARRWDGMRIALLADLHASDIVAGSTIQRAFEMAGELRPAFIAVVGDWVTDNDVHLPDIVAALQAVPRGIPVLGVLGNHDYFSERGPNSLARRVADGLSAEGVKMLRNDVLMPGGETGGLSIVGLEDLLRGAVDRGTFLRVPAEHKIIVLEHNPDGADELADCRWDVMLSGHTHGGQVILPGLPPLHLPVRNKARYSGMYRVGERLLYVNRGIGSYVHVRVNCLPEVTCLTLRTV